MTLRRTATSGVRAKVGSLSLHGSNDLEAALYSVLVAAPATVSASTEAMTLRRNFIRYS